MKRFWLAAGLLCAMLLATLVNARHMDNLTASLTDALQAAETMARRGSWEQAEVITRQCLEDWNGSHAYLHIVCRHADTDQILISFHRTLQHIQLEEMDEYAAENRELMTKIGLLAEMEQPDLMNVF